MKKPSLTKKNKVKLFVVALISLLLALALELYTFGVASDFILRWLRAFFVFFVMIGSTVFVIVPLVAYGVAKAGRS
ncbi:DUF2798 domain-containing protein [Pontibacter arcticus]|uniref:DUF2798 domain-containing protein n=1 Tax=Pontibacter arcticus TaxID=2080288 RepID=A0A364RI37_9BACT|nr:DUF2798 domain-containing protein [Pontibacter arcticus]RAU83908.1 DUF2798 domain-containing protein [Pontibacter arcticus]